MELKISTLKHSGISILLLLLLTTITFASADSTTETDDKNYELSADSFYMYQTTVLEGRSYTVSLSSDIKVDFFILDPSTADIYYDILRDRSSKTFDDLTILFDSYQENVTTHSTSITIETTQDVRFVIDNTDLTGANEGAQAIISVLIVYEENSVLPGFELYVSLIAFVTIVIAARKTSRF